LFDLRRALASSQSTNQTTFIVTTSPTNMAGQLKSGTSLGAAYNIANTKPIFTISHKKNPVTAVAGLIVDTLLNKPRANNAPGMTTAIAPYMTDQPTAALPDTHHATKAVKTPPAA
jgi:hypothetical protein